VSGQIEMLITGIATSSGASRAGQVRALVMTARGALAAGARGADDGRCRRGRFCPRRIVWSFYSAATPGEVIERLSRELPAISRNPDFSKRLVDIGQGSPSRCSRGLRPQHPRRGGALERAFHHGRSKGRVMLKLDIFPHIFPQPYFERMKQIAEGNPSLAAQLKRWMHIPGCGTSTSGMRMMKRFPGTSRS